MCVYTYVYVFFCNEAASIAEEKKKPCAFNRVVILHVQAYAAMLSVYYTP